MKAFFSILILLGIFAFFLPELLSTEIGNKILKIQMAKKTGIEITSAKFSWMGPQILQGLTFKSGTKKITATSLIFQNKEFLLSELEIWIGGHHLKGDQIALDIGKDAHVSLFSPLEKSHLPNMTLRMGKLIWQNFGTLKDLFSILQLKIRVDSEISILFQDAPCSFKNGVLNFDRTEFLVDDTYQFSLWKDIDFANNEYNLFLGIPAITIQKVLDMHNLPPSYTIPMRLTGPLDDPILHKSTALKTIAKLLLLQQVPLAPIPTLKPTPPIRYPLPWH